MDSCVSVLLLAHNQSMLPCFRSFPTFLRPDLFVFKGTDIATACNKSVKDTSNKFTCIVDVSVGILMHRVLVLMILLPKEQM